MSFIDSGTMDEDHSYRNRPAGFWVRFFAGLLDGIVLALFFGLLQVLGLHFLKGWSRSVVVQMLYELTVPLLWNGYSVGKRLLGIRIVKTDGEAPGLGNLLLRAVTKTFLYEITYGIVLLISVGMVALREDKRSIHDFISGTQVVHVGPEEVPSNWKD